MCILCDQGKPQDHARRLRSQLGRRDFLKASTASPPPRGGGL
jgi:hypothetical protein